MTTREKLVMDGIQATSTSGKRKLSHPEETVVRDVHNITVDVESRDTANPPFSISIVGGGIAGLGAALALQKKGFLVTVFERDLLFEDRRQGYGLTLTNNPQGPLADLDLLDECISRDCPSNAHWIFAPEGNVLGYYGRSFKSDAETPSGIPAIAPRDSQFEGRGNLRIPRQNLRKMMLDRLRPGTVRWGMKLLDYEEGVDGVKCYFQSTNKAQLSEKDGSCGTGDSSMPNCEEKGDSSNTARLLDNIEEVHADILVGADGIRSVVRQLRSQKTGALGNKQLIKESSPLSFVGVAVILGISTVTHPLINRQGFYCLDGTNRLFTMPFEDGDSKPYVPSSSDGSTSPGMSLSSAQEPTGEVHESKSADCPDGSSDSVDRCSDKSGKTKLTMWQLSFSDFTEEEGVRLRSAGPEELLNEALRRCKDWFNPVCDMIKGTPPREVWGTGLYDRDPMPLRGKDQGSRVTVIGDACHPMSMFKGQGANQALCDGPLLASWLHSGGSGAVKNATKCTSNNSNANKIVGTDLTSQNVYTRLRCFEREMVARTTAKVMGSRAAAAQLHSPAVLTENFGVEGVKTAMSAVLLRRVHQLQIGAHHSSDLELKLRHAIKELQTETEVALEVQTECPQTM